MMLISKINKENLTDLVKEKIPDIFNDQKSMIADSIMQKLSNKQISDTASLDTLREAIIPALDTPSDSAVTIRMLLDIGKTNPAEKARKYEDISQKILKTFIDDLHILKINDTEKNAFNGGDTNLNKAINECSKSIVTDFPLVFQHGIQTAKTYEGWDQFIATVKTKLPELNEQSISDDIKSGSKLEQLLTCLPTAFSEAAQSDGFIPQIQHNHLNEYLANTLFEGSQKNLTPEKITELQNTYKDAGMDLKPLPALPNASHTDSLTSKPLPALPNASHTDSLTSKPLPALPEKLDDNSESIHSKDKESRELSSEDNNAKLAELAQLNGMLLDQLNNDDQKQSPVDSGFEDMSSNDDNESIISNSDSFVSATSSLFNDSESFVSATSSLRDDNERV